MRLSEPIPEWLQKRWDQGTLEEDAGTRSMFESQTFEIL